MGITVKNYGYFNVINRYKAPFITNYDGLEVYEATFDDIYTLYNGPMNSDQL